MRLAVLFLSVCLYPCLAGEDLVIRWNSVALDAIRALNTPPPAASRNLAILHASVYDAVNGIRRTHQPYFVTQVGPSDASLEAAAAAAARKVLLTLYPTRQAQIDAEYLNSVGKQNNSRTLRGAQWGDFVAGAILQARSNDGSANTVPYTPGTLPGQWRPTVSFGGIVRPALAAQWGFVRPFGLKVGTQFRPPAPPALNTAEYAADVNGVKALGSINSTARTADQTEIGQFWGYGPNTSTPPGH